jgi:hypothetical protein
MHGSVPQAAAHYARNKTWAMPNSALQQTNPEANFTILPMIQGRYSTNYAETAAISSRATRRTRSRAIQVLPYIH